MRTIFAIIFFICFKISAQNFSIKEVKLSNKERGISFTYPIISTRNLKVDKIINKKIEERILDVEEQNASLEQKLNLISKEGLITIQYEVTFHKNNILSLNVYAEGCGAYCEGHYQYFNFDLLNGKYISTTDLIEASKLEVFKKKINNDIKESLINYKNIELKNFNEDTNVISFAIESMNYCINNIEFDQFSLTSNGIELISICPFPHAIRALGPGNNYIYEYNFFKEYLSKEYGNRIAL